YSPGRAPSSDRKVVSRKLPSASVRPLAGRPPSAGAKVTVAPDRGWPSRVTTPSTLTGLPRPPQPAAASSRAGSNRPSRGLCLGHLIVASSKSFPGRKGGGAGRSRQRHGLPVVADDELDERDLVDALVDEVHRPVEQREVHTAGVVRLEPHAGRQVV